jgi:hypothetical protein
MSEPRLGSALLVNALLRLAARSGGFGAVLQKGDANAGAITVILAERGERRMVLERLVQPDGRYSWQDLGNRGALNEEEFSRFLERRRRFDRDLWLIELDVPSAERFADEMAELD